MPIFEELDQRYPSQTHQLQRFQELFERVRHLPGDFAEFGCYNGNGVRELAQLDPERTAWAFDTFDGMPVEDYGGDEDRSDPPGKWKPDAAPTELFAGIPNIRVVQGRFADTLPTVPVETRFVMGHIDCDWYASHLQVLHFLERHSVFGATFLLDDPGLPGAHRALTEWCASVGERARWDGGCLLVWNG